jgi:hypothetical protein
MVSRMTNSEICGDTLRAFTPRVEKCEGLGNPQGKAK